MRLPVLCLAFLTAAPAAFSAAAAASAFTEHRLEAAAQAAPIQLGPKTAEGFDDPAHLHFFRYQAYLRRKGLYGLDAAAWKSLGEKERAAKIKAGEEWLRDKLGELMGKRYLFDADTQLLSAVWGRDVESAVEAASKAAELGDPDQIRAAREKVSGLVKNVGGAAVDWSAIFDESGARRGTAPGLPVPLALKKKKPDFLASLESKDVRTPLASKASFVAFLREKEVADVALPALTAMYDVLSRAKEPEKSETAHLLPTVVRFLNDGKKIVNSESEKSNALAFAQSGEHDRPERVVITSLSRDSDSVEVGFILAHEFEHVYDMYAGRYYTLDSELRGFKTGVLFRNIMKKDPRMSKKLDELMNSDDDATRSYFQDQENVAAAYAQSPKTFAEMVAFGHGYNQYPGEGFFYGRLTLREAVDPETGFQRQISAQNDMLKLYQKQSAALQARLEAIRGRPSSIANEKDLAKATSDLADVQTREIFLRKEAALGALRLGRMQRERAWMDSRAAASGQPPPAYDLSLPVGKDYAVSGD